MEDYKKVRECVDSLIGTGDTYFNSLGQERTEVTFVEMEDGPVLRKGKKGAFVCPQMAPFETMDAGQMEKKARLLAERPADWITVKYVDEPYRVRVETAHAKICFAKDGSMESFYDRDLDREWTDGAFHKLHIYQDLPGVYDAWDILPNYKEKELEITVKKPLRSRCCPQTAVSASSSCSPLCQAPPQTMHMHHLPPPDEAVFSQ